MMFAEVASLSVHPEAMDALIRHFQDAVAEGLAGQRGFAGMLLLTDRQAGQALALLLWETGADLLASTAAQSQRLLPTCLLIQQARMVSYEVSVHAERTEQGMLWMHGI
jgi:conjugal transfer/entry exclusion protein